MQSALAGIGRSWMGLSALVQCALVVALLLVKNGVDIELRNVQEAYIPGLQAFPKPTGYFSSSLGNTALAYALGADSTVKWVALHVVLVAAALVLALVMATRTSIAVRSDTLLLLASATAAAAVMISIGKYDPLTFLGGWTIVMARGPWMSGVGALVMALGNPEQAVVAGACLLVVSLAKEFAGWRRRAIWSLAVSPIRAGSHSTLVHCECFSLESFVDGALLPWRLNREFRDIPGYRVVELVRCGMVSRAACAPHVASRISMNRRSGFDRYSCAGDNLDGGRRQGVRHGRAALLRGGWRVAFQGTRCD
ncbi:MAG: hypothetical protein WCI74_11190 [Actinomycetes bacterium]